jgi:hypothetical protein
MSALCQKQTLCGAANGNWIRAMVGVHFQSCLALQVRTVTPPHPNSLDQGRFWGKADMDNLDFHVWALVQSTLAAVAECGTNFRKRPH